MFMGVAQAKRCASIDMGDAQELGPGAADAKEKIFMGQSIRVFGGRAVFGGYGLNGYRGGAWSYVYNGTKWNFEQQLTIPNAKRGDHGGLNLGYWGNTVVMGAPFDEPYGKNSGSAHVFELVDGKWEHKQRLVAPDGHRASFFGYATDIQKDMIVVGARRQNNPTTGTERAGAVYIYKRKRSGKWKLFQTLYGNNYAFQWGDEVRIDGFSPPGVKRLLVGAPRAQPATRGRAVLFTWDEELGRFNRKKVVKVDEGYLESNPKTHFGEGLSLRQDRLIIGGERGASPVGTSSGSAYVFKINEDGTVKQMDGLFPTQPGNSNFGQRVSHRGQIAVVGAWTSSERGRHTGSAYIYGECDDGSWKLLRKVLAPNAASGEEFGKMVYINGKHIAIAAPKRNTGLEGRSNRGAVYMYRYTAVPF